MEIHQIFSKSCIQKPKINKCIRFIKNQQNEYESWIILNNTNILKNSSDSNQL